MFDFELYDRIDDIKKASCTGNLLTVHFADSTETVALESIGNATVFCRVINNCIYAFDSNCDVARFCVHSALSCIELGADLNSAADSIGRDYCDQYEVGVNRKFGELAFDIASGIFNEWYNLDNKQQWDSDYPFASYLWPLASDLAGNDRINDYQIVQSDSSDGEITVTIYMDIHDPDHVYTLRVYTDQYGDLRLTETVKENPDHEFADYVITWNTLSSEIKESIRCHLTRLAPPARCDNGDRLANNGAGNSMAFASD